MYPLRKAKKITQSQLADKLGVSEQSVSKWENCQCAPDVSLFPVIADYFGVSIDGLFGYHMNSYSAAVKQIIKATDDSMDTYREIEIIGDGLKKISEQSGTENLSCLFSVNGKPYVGRRK